MSDDDQAPPDAQDELRTGPFVLWALVAALLVPALFLHVLHDHIGHGAAILAAGAAGPFIGAAGYRWGGGNASTKGAGYTAALGGGLGLLALHVLPLLH